MTLNSVEQENSERSLPGFERGRTSLECLVTVARQHGIELSAERLARDYALSESEASPALMVRMATEAGLKAKWTKLTWSGLISAGKAFPLLIRLDNGNWVSVAGLEGDGGAMSVLIVDPLAEINEALKVPRAQFCQRWQGDTLLLKRMNQASNSQEQFGFRWFAPEIFRQRSLFIDVIVAAIFLYALGLASPIFFQIIIDKVLIHQSYATLYVLSGGMAAALKFDAIFTYLRRYLLLYATNRIDIRVATRTFSHLLRLPMSFFETMPAGVIVRHMQQSGRVREFLTGRLFLALLDSLSLLVFLPVLLLYSVKLTLLVLLFTSALKKSLFSRAGLARC